QPHARGPQDPSGAERGRLQVARRDDLPGPLLRGAPPAARDPAAHRGRALREPDPGEAAGAGRRRGRPDRGSAQFPLPGRARDVAVATRCLLLRTASLTEAFGSKLVLGGPARAALAHWRLATPTDQSSNPAASVDDPSGFDDQVLGEP